MQPQDFDVAKQAVSVLDKFTGQAPLTRVEHVQAQQALQFLTEFVGKAEGLAVAAVEPTKPPTKRGRRKPADPQEKPGVENGDGT